MILKISESTQRISIKTGLTVVMAFANINEKNGVRTNLW